MKTALVIFVLLGTCYCQTWFSVGTRVDGDEFLGFDSAKSNDTTELTLHTVTMRLDLAEGSLITYVHVNVFDAFTVATFPAMFENSFWVEIMNANTTSLLADMAIYGFPASANATEDIKPPVITRLVNPPRS